MDNRLKLILIGLAALLLISLAFSFYTLVSKNQVLQNYEGLKQTKDRLEKENNDLVSQITSFMEEKQRVVTRVSSIEKELDAVSKQRDEFKNKYTLLEKEKKALIEKLQKLSSAKKEIETPEGAEQMPIYPTDDAYWGSILRDSAELKIKVKDLENELTAVKLKYTGLDKEKQGLHSEMETIKEQRGVLVKEINRDDEVTKNLSIDLAREKNENKEIKMQLDKIKEDKQGLEKQLAELENKLGMLNEKLSLMEREKIFLETHVSELEELTEAMAKQETQREKQMVLSNRKNIVELSPIIVKPIEEPKKEVPTASGETIQPTAKEISGKIVSVNNDDNFVVINLGEADGIKLGQELGVFRNKKKIANIEVIKIRDNISACDIKNVVESIKVGDVVK